MRTSRHMLCSDTGKVIHWNRKLAQGFVTNKGGLVVYQCNHCKYWHTAKSAKAKRREMREKEKKDSRQSHDTL